LDRSTYTALFKVIGSTFGSIDSETFNLPDYRGRVIGQPGQGTGLTNRIMGTVAGAEEQVLTINELPAHTHSGVTSSTGAHSHSVTDPGHTHTQTTINDDFNNTGSNPPGFTADGSGSMTWSNISSSTTGITVNAAGQHEHTFTTASTGGGAAHNNMQPTLFGANVFIFSGVEV
jgi:microcystin-dependent protein